MKGFEDWSEWSVGARVACILALIGFVILTALAMALGQAWPIGGAAFLLFIYGIVYTQDARRRGVPQVKRPASLVRGFEDWSEWSVGARITCIATAIGFLIFLVLGIALGQPWPMVGAAFLLFIHIIVYARDAQRRGVYRRPENKGRIKRMLPVYALGGVMGVVIALLKAR